MLRMFALCVFVWPILVFPATYYVSSSSGDDDNTGLSEGSAFQSIAKVNSLSLSPGDRVLFKCGDTWRGEMLVITDSGSASQDIFFGSYPENGTPKPRILGTHPVAGWNHFSGSIYVANLQAGLNSGLFTSGINQVFIGGDRQVLGRWPNPGQGTFSDGYSEIDGPASNAANLVDDELPVQDWSGAVAHIKGMRWYILNRVVTSSVGHTLNLNSATDCWAGSCEQWGYFLNNHLATLDRDGEWYYDHAAGLLYVYSNSGLPVDVEASAVLGDPERYQAGVILGEDLARHIQHVTLDNLEVSRWFMHGISTPLNWETEDNSHITIQNCLVQDVDSIGINLAGWVWNASNGRNGWRGGHQIQVLNCQIFRANHFGINSYAYDSSFIGNELRDIGLIESSGATGIGCGDDSSGGFCTEFGDGFRIKIHNELDSGHGNWVERNRIIRAGYCGFDVFGSDNTFLNNVVEDTCFSKGDCGAIRTFGQNSLLSTPVFDLTIEGNLFLNTIGNTDGAHPDFRSLFGFGIYIDHYSARIQVQDNTIVDSTASGILFQNSSGSIVNNTCFNNSRDTSWRGQVTLALDSTIEDLSQNIMYGQHPTTWTLRAPEVADIQNSNFNYFFNPYREQHISVAGDKTLPQWRSFSGFDSNSSDAWFSLEPEELQLGQIFLNSTDQTQTVDLQGSTYFDLDQGTVAGSIQVPAFGSRVLVLDQHCDLSAELIGDATICAGGTAELRVNIQGSPPWSVEWADGLVQPDWTTTPVTRMVAPSDDTVYEVLRVFTNFCERPGSGRATVLVGNLVPLRIEPEWKVQGIVPVELTARLPCDWDVEGITWLDNGQVVAQVQNPLAGTYNAPGVHQIQVTILHDGGTQDSYSARVLVPFFPETNLDPDGNGMNSMSDLLHVLEQWRLDSTTDPDNSGRWDVRDFLFVPTL